MHKMAKEMGKWAMEWAKATGYDNITDQGWDNLKDCMEAVKAAICADKEYREVEEMDEYGDMEKLEKMLSVGNERMGYRGRDSRGRFVHRPGRGRSAGYTPYLHMMDDMYEDDEPYWSEMMNYRMGYSGQRSGNSGGGRGGNYGMNRGGQGGNSGRSGYDGEDYDGVFGYSDGRQGNSGRDGRSGGSRYGQSYDRYSDARRHYHDEKDMESMKKMEESFGDILEDFGEIADDTWKDLSPEQKNKQKPKINQMIQKLQKLQQM